MIRFRSISIALIVAALAVSARAQGTTGGLLYAVDFANWTLPQGNTPAQGAIIYPNQDICKVTSNGYTFLAPKVGRPITIVDGVNTETVTPTSVVVGSIGCIISAVMTHSHSSYFLKSGTGGAQEAVDYQASQPQGANVILTPAWTQAGGTTGTITGTLKGNAGVTILDQRTAALLPYVWNGSQFVAQPFGGGSGTVSGQTSGKIPLATAATVIGAPSHLDDGVTTPSTITSTEGIAAPSLSTPSLSVTACTPGQIPLGDGSGTCISPSAGTGTITPSPQLSLGYFHNAGTASTIQGDSNTNTDGSGHFGAIAVRPAQTPYADITNSAYGAVIDDVTPIDTAMSAAWTAATGSGGSGTVFLPCGTAGCYLANGSLLSAVTTPTNVTKIKIQGKLTLGSTWVTPDNTDIVCDGNGIPQQFQISGPSCFIDAPHVTGTMGTSTSAINTPTTFTPTFTAGSAANMPADSAITIGGTVSCPITNITRTLLAGPFPGIGPTNVTATVSGACRIPPGSYITIAGVTDTSFNAPGPGLFIITDDYPSGVLAWRQVGAAATSSGGTVTGTNMDSVETVRIQSSVAGVMTATFNRAHSASDVWGMVGMTPKFAGLRHHGFYGIHLAHNYGAGFWGDGNALMTFSEVGFTGLSYPTSFGMEFASSWAWTFAASATNSNQAYVCPTVSVTCAQNGLPYGMRITELPSTQLGTSSVGAGFIGPNSTVSEGILIDTEGAGGTPFMQGPELFNSVIEQPMENGITFDPRGTSQIYQTTIYGASLIQDSIVTSRAKWVGLTDPDPGQGDVLFLNAANLNYIGDTIPGEVGATVNKYFCGHVTLAGNSGYDHFVWPSCPSATVTYSGSKLAGELSGSGAAFSPSFIPYVTKAVTTNVTTCAGTGCSVTSGILAPDQTNTAFQVNAGAGNYATAQYLNYFNASTAAGDVLLYGVWTRSAAGLTSGSISMTTFGTDTFDLTSTQTFQGGIDNEPWHVVVGMSTALTGQAGAHAISFLLNPSQTVQGTSAQFWQPFVIHVPASANIPADEISRWRANLLHGYVPSGLATGGVLEIDPALPMYWGTDTNLYRSAAGVLKTDGAFDAAGYKLAGSYGTSGQVLQSTGGGTTWGNGGAIPSPLPNWRTKLLGVKVGTGNATVIWLGDSTIFGYNSSPTNSQIVANSAPVKWCTDLVSYYGIRCEWNSWFGGGNLASFGTLDSRTVQGSSWTVDAAALSIGYKGMMATTNTNAYSFTPAVWAGTSLVNANVDTCDVFTIQQSGNGTMSVNIDGGTATLINESGTAAVIKTTIAAGSLGTHTINHFWSSGGKVDLLGDHCYDSTTSHVSVFLAGVGGATSAKLTDQTAAYGPGFPAPYVPLAPDLAIIEAGVINDWNTVSTITTTASKANVQTLTNALITAGADVALYAPNPQDPAAAQAPTNDVQSTYVEAMRQVAAGTTNTGTTAKIPFIDNFTAWQSFAVASPRLWYGDGTHPNGVGYQELATASETATVASVVQASPFGANIAPWSNIVPASLVAYTQIGIGSNYTVTPTVPLIYANGAGITVTFPASPLTLGFTNGAQINVVNIGISAVTVSSPGGGFSVPTTILPNGSITVTILNGAWAALSTWNANNTANSIQWRTVTPAGNYTVLGTEGNVRAVAGAIITLPSPPTGIAQGYQVQIHNTGASGITITGSPSISSLAAGKIATVYTYANVWYLSSTTDAAAGSITINGTACAVGGSCTIGTAGATVGTPQWLQYLGAGEDGSNISASGNLSGERNYVNFTVPFGNTVTVNNLQGLVIHATGTCTIAGTITARNASNSQGVFAGSGGGSGGGASVGTAGTGSFTAVSGGSGLLAAAAGGISGGNGTNGSALSAQQSRFALAGGGGVDMAFFGGGSGKAGANSGGAAGNPGGAIVLMCGTITGTDGTNTGTIDASGGAGGNAPGNSTGAGSGGGGGIVVLSSQNAIATLPTINVAGGAGGTCAGFTTCGTGGSGGNGWSASFQSW